MTLVNVFQKLWNSAFVAQACLSERKIAFAPKQQLQQLQTRRLQALIHFAFKEIPYYRSKMQSLGLHPHDFKTAADLAKLPLTPKLDLTLQPELFAPQGSNQRDGLTLLSSGTSGLRRSFRHDTNSILTSLAAGRRQRLALQHFTSKESGYREAVINRPGHAGEQIRAFIESRTITPARLELKRLYASPSLPFAQLLARLNEFQPTVVRGIGSHLGAFYRWVHDSGSYLHKPLAITYGADAMLPSDRQLIETELNIPIVSTYQSVESLRIGFECEHRTGFHISTDQVAFRVAGPNGEDVAPGQRGELILTNLINRATVVLNYQLGDYVTLSDAPCPCGRNFPLIRSVDGRLDDLIARPDGTKIPALVLLPSLQSIPGIRQVQIEQLDFNSFYLKILPLQGQSFDHAAVHSVFSKQISYSVKIEIETVSHLPSEASGKMKSFSSKMASS